MAIANDSLGLKVFPHPVSYSGKCIEQPLLRFVCFDGGHCDRPAFGACVLY